MKNLLFLICLSIISTNVNGEIMEINCTDSTFVSEHGNYNSNTKTKSSFDINLENKYMVATKLEYSIRNLEKFNSFFIIEKKENNIIYANNKFLNRSEKIREMIINSNIVASVYENEIQAEIISNIQLILREIIKVSNNKNEVNINSIKQELNEFINLSTISNIYLFNKSGEIYLNFEDQENKNFLLPSDDIFQILAENRIYIFQLNKNFISAYKKIDFVEDFFVQVNKELNNNIFEHISVTKDANKVLNANKDMEEILLEFNLDEKTIKYSFNNSKKYRIFSNCELTYK